MAKSKYGKIRRAILRNARRKGRSLSVAECSYLSTINPHMQKQKSRKDARKIFGRIGALKRRMGFLDKPPI